MRGNFRPFLDWVLFVTSANVFPANLSLVVERVSGLAFKRPSVISNGEVDRRLLFGGAFVFGFDFVVGLGGSKGSAISLWCKGPVRGTQLSNAALIGLDTMSLVSKLSCRRAPRSSVIPGICCAPLAIIQRRRAHRNSFRGLLVL